jgi:hypothetical protein
MSRIEYHDTQIGNVGGGVLINLLILSSGLVYSISHKTLKGLIWWSVSDAILDAIEEPIAIEHDAQKSWGKKGD